MVIAETARIRVRHLTAADAIFTLQLLNQPSFIDNIADKGVRNTEDALCYLADGPIKSYHQYGYGLFMVERADTATSLGFCGLLYRDTLRETDIGFAFMPQHCGQGYALESARVVLHYGYNKLQLNRIVGLTTEHNKPSINLLTKLGMAFEKEVVMQPEKKPVLLFS